MSDIRPNISIQIGELFNANHPEEQAQITLDIQKSVRSTLDSLGLVGSIEVQFVAELDHIKINDQRCDYSDSWLDEIKRYIERSNQNITRDTTSFWGLLFQGLLFRQPEILFTENHLETCLANFSIAPNSIKEKEQWRALFEGLLNKHISLKNESRISELIDANQAKGLNNFVELEETLIDELQSNKIDILLSKKYFHSITKDDIHTGKDNLFYMMRYGLYYELGMTYPDFNLAFIDLPEQVVQFRINDQLTLPMLGIGANEILMDGNVSRLGSAEKKIVGASLKNPANGKEGTLLDAKYQSLVNEMRIYKWDALGYFILLVSKTLREDRTTFVTKSFVKQQLGKLKTYYHRNVELISNQYSDDYLAKLFRMLVAENISIRNMKTICNHLVQCDSIVIDESQYIIFDDRIPTMDSIAIDRKKDLHFALQYVRNSLKEYLSHQVSRGQNTLNVYLLDINDIEKRIKDEVAQDVFPSKEMHDQLLLAIDEEIKTLPSGNQMPSILTTSSIRPYVRKLTQYRFPTLKIIAYQELSPSMNIQPVARLKFS